MISSFAIILLPVMGIQTHRRTGQLNVRQLLLTANAAKLVELVILGADDLKQPVQRVGQQVDQQVDQLQLKHTARP